MRGKYYFPVLKFSRHSQSYPLMIIDFYHLVEFGVRVAPSNYLFMSFTKITFAALHLAMTNMSPTHLRCNLVYES